MSFGGLFITNRGRALQAKAQTGVQLNFTKLAVGDGQLSGQSISDLTELIHQIKTLELNKFKTLPGGKAVVGGVLSNQDIVTGFYWRELGVFAQDPDLGEILYCYGNAGDLAEYIPAPGGAEILEKQVDVITLVGNASNVSASIEQSLVYITQGEKGEPGGVASLDDTGKVPAEQLAAANQYTDQEVGAVAQAQASHEAESVSQSGGVHGLIMESGTFTPYFTKGTNIYARQIGEYTRVGDLVEIYINLELSSKGEDTTGNLYVGGLPFIPKGYSILNIRFIINSNINYSTYPNIKAVALPNSINLAIYKYTVTYDTVGLLEGEDLNNNTWIILSGTYRI